MIPDDARSSSAGFGVVEVLISAATFAIVAFVLVGLVHEYSLTAQTLTAKQHSHLDVARLLDAWQTDSSSADAVFIPDADVFGSDNTAVPHEVDFYTKDAGNRPYFWAYYFDSMAHTLQRYDYASPGNAPQKDGNAYANITQFTPSLHAISEISNPASPIYAPIFGTAVNYDVALGFPKVVGGTHIVHIDLRTPYETVPAELEAGGAPSGFTVVLNYTPAPKPTPKLALGTWPIAVAYGLNNTDVADASRLPMQFNVAAMINAFVGGGVAQAAGCHAIAYTDAAMTQIDRNDSTFRSTLGITTDSNGCYGGEVVAYEPSGAIASYQVQNGTSCWPYVNFTVWNPTSATGIRAAKGVQGGPTPTSNCSIVVTDGAASPATLGHGIVDAAIYSCAGPFMFSPNGQPYCNWHLLFQSGYSGTVAGGANSDGWFAQPASALPPVVDCRVPPDGNGAGGCQTISNGAIEYCYNAQQNTPNLTVTIAEGNTTGFGCGNIGNPHDWPILPCKNPPGNPRYCLGPKPPPQPPGG